MSNTDKVKQLIIDNPGITQLELREKLSLDKQQLRSLMEHLRTQGFYFSRVTARVGYYYEYAYAKSSGLIAEQDIRRKANQKERSERYKASREEAIATAKANKSYLDKLWPAPLNQVCR